MQLVVCKMWIIITCLLGLGVVRGNKITEPLVETNLGVIKGLYSYEGDYYMFLGIPYGKVDKSNPFGVATPYPRFEEPFLANDDSVKCPQVEEFNNTIVGTLDCLLLNIHVPSGVSSRSKLPVLVWLYGGIFQFGFAGRYLYGPKHLIKHDVIFVTLNYRNGPYGFMCLDTPDVPGNQGLKDQLLALRWIKDNIESFGGDINKVTLGGESSGGASVAFQIWSNKETLFNQAIIQSGSVFAPWALTETDLKQPIKLAKRLGYYTDDLSKALSFLAKTDVKSLMAAVRDLSMMFKVCVEKEFENVEGFLIEHPRHLNVPKARNISIIIGSTDKERMGLYENKPESAFKYMDVFNKSLSEIFNYDEDFLKMEDIVRKFYIGDEELGNKVKEKLTDYSSDFDFIYPTQKSLQTFLDNGAKNIYNYVFTYSGDRSFTKKRGNLLAKGAAHADAISFLFDMTYDPSTPTREDQKFIDMFTTLWTNFVKYGNPTPETTELIPIKWSPVSKKLHTYLNISSVLSEGISPFNDRMAFWKLFFEANKIKLRSYNVATPYPKFRETFLAFDDTVKCPQVEKFNNTIVGTLDCLHLNIYVPSGASSRSKLPVLVWIYGGGFRYGFAGRYLYGPKYIVKHDVIMVSLNYRLGPYGFMCLDTPEVSGNQGLKDQLLALRWINNNIESFGGDVNKITIGGESAGACSVDAHLWSKQEKLFNQAILHSGSIFGPWAYTKSNNTQPLILAKHLGYDTDDLSKALLFLAKTDVKVVIATVTDLSMEFKLCVEKEFENVERFIIDYPRNMNVPKANTSGILIGITSQESMGDFLNKQESDFKNMNVFNTSLNQIFNYDKNFFEMEDIVRRFYIGDKEISKAVQWKIIDFSSDYNYIYPVNESIQNYLDNGAEKVYHYMFSYSGERNLMKKKDNITANGAIHADELSYLFDMMYDPSTPTKDDQRVIDITTALWTNFIKYGDPTPQTSELLPIKWLPITKKALHYVNIDLKLSQGTRLFNDRMAFWKLFIKANKYKLQGYKPEE